MQAEGNSSRSALHDSAGNQLCVKVANTALDVSSSLPRQRLDPSHLHIEYRQREPDSLEWRDQTANTQNFDILLSQDTCEIVRIGKPPTTFSASTAVHHNHGPMSRIPSYKTVEESNMAQLAVPNNEHAGLRHIGLADTCEIAHIDVCVALLASEGTMVIKCASEFNSQKACGERKHVDFKLHPRMSKMLERMGPHVKLEFRKDGRKVTTGKQIRHRHKVGPNFATPIRDSIELWQTDSDHHRPSPRRGQHKRSQGCRSHWSFGDYWRRPQSYDHGGNDMSVDLSIDQIRRGIRQS